MTADSTTFRVDASRELPAIIRGLGHDPQDIFAESGVEMDLFDHGENRIAAAALGLLLANAARRTGREDIGLLVAERFRPTRLGLVGLLAAEGPDVRTSLRNLVRLIHHNSQATFLSASMSDAEVTLRYELREPAIEGANHVFVGVIAMAMRMMQALCGRDWQPDEVQLSRRSPQDVAPYRRFFRAPVRFNAAQDALVFEGRWLDHPVAPPGQPGVSPSFTGEGRAMSEIVGTLVSRRLGLEPVSAAELAAEIGNSRRALDRQLAGEGVSCQHLVDSIRFARARRLLADGDAPLSDIAFALGYPDSSVFSRAFRRWGDLSPSAWRKQNATA
jgi:AraC-like DNA-binding protein